MSMAHPLASKSRDQSRRARTGNTSRQQPRLHSPLCPHCTQTTAYTTPNKAWQTNTKNRKKGRKKKKGSLKFPKTILNLSSNPAMPNDHAVRIISKRKCSCSGNSSKEVVIISMAATCSAYPTRRPTGPATMANVFFSFSDLLTTKYQRECAWSWRRSSRA